MPSNTKTVLFAAAILTAGVIGCGDDGGTGTSYSEAPVAPANPDAHNHPSEGPHDGELIELGNEEYHAEMLHDDDAGTITIYVLDSGATKTVPIDATDVTINLVHDGAATQFKLAADPEDSDPEGQSCRFVSSDAELHEALDAEGAEAKLVLMIAGTSFTGELHHDH